MTSADSIPQIISPPNSSKSSLTSQSVPSVKDSSVFPPAKKTGKDLTKAERRAIQEKQRADKEAKKGAAPTPPSSKSAKKQDSKPATKQGKTEPESANTTPSKVKESSKDRGLTLFSHLDGGFSNNNKVGLVSVKEVHPSILEVAAQFRTYKICGSNARCIAMLKAFKKVIEDYITPPQTPLCRHLVAHLSPQISYLVTARPMSITMGNAIRYLKREISTVDPDLPEDQAKQFLLDSINTFLRDRITAADQIIADNSLEKIQNGDVIMTYGSSSIIQQVLENAYSKKIDFRVIIIDAGPRFEGKHMLRKLAKIGVQCTYALLNGVAYIAKEATKVFLGAHGIFSNGTLLSRTGTAMVAMTGYDQKIPVIVCCETYKFSEKNQLDSIVWNEIGNPKELILTPSHDPTLISSQAKSNPAEKQLEEAFDTTKNLFALNLLYDLTPSDYISMVITEVGMIPCTSVPVVLREYGALMQ